MADIFISYAREDQARIRGLVSALEKQGWSIFWDRRIPAGKTWQSYIGRALSDAKCVMVAWSQHSITSDWVIEEANDGKKRGLLIPVLLDSVEPPLGFRSIQAADLAEWKPGSSSLSFDQLIQDIAEVVGGKPPRPTTQEELPGQTQPVAPPEGISTELPPEEPQPSVPPEKRKPIREEKRIRAPAPVKPARIIEPGAVFQDPLRDGSKGPEMVIVPAGSFEMGDLWGDGDSDEKPVHNVRIPRPFALGKYPVTFEDYGKFAKDMGRDLPRDEGWGRGRRPVINVSWEDAGAFTEWLSQETGKRYRLPSEAEWEYAARSGGKKEKWAGTSSEGELDDFAWYSKNSKDKTHPVGEKKPNGLGLYDMSGNVWEWVQDCWHESLDNAPGDGSAWEEKDGGDCSMRVVRGGSWGSKPWTLRISTRSVPADNRLNYVGFRLAQDIE